MTRFSLFARIGGASALCALLWTAAGASQGFDPSNIDPSVAACKDFYAYANGGWIARHPIPPDRSRFNGFDLIAQRNEELARRILEEAAANPNASGDTKRIGDFYASCIDVAAIERLGAKPVVPLMAQIDAIADPRSLADELAHLHDLGFGALWTLGATLDPKDSARQIAFVAPSGLGLPDREFYVRADARSEQIRSAYAAHVAALFRLFGDAPARAEEEAKSVLTFESRLAREQLTRVAARDPNATYNPMRVAELAALSPHVGWERYLAERKLAQSGAIDVTDPAYVKALDAAFERPALPDVKTYLRWRVLSQSAPSLSNPFADEDFALQRVLSGEQAPLVRWKRCTRLVDRLMGDALGRIWVERSFSPAAKIRVEAMARSIREVLADDIRTLPWMSDATRAGALAKLEALRALIGYPQRWRAYDGLTIARTDYWGNVRAASAYDLAWSLGKIGKPVDKGEFGMTPPTVNAYYSGQRNEIVFPAGILQPPFFDPAADDAINYGAIGAVIGHETTHGFDDRGRRFDAEGNLHDWWTPDDAKAFTARAQCVIDQFDGYATPEIPLNGRLVVGEAIADLGGATIAYRALERAQKRRPKTTLDGFTPEQRFFLGFAQYFAGSARPERTRTRALSDPHPPDRLRVNGTLSNLPEFAEAFHCQAGDPMVRPAKERCAIW